MVSQSRIWGANNTYLKHASIWVQRQTCDQYVHANATRRRVISQFIDSFLGTSNLCHEDELSSVNERCQINSEDVYQRVLGILGKLSLWFVVWHAHHHCAYKSHTHMTCTLSVGTFCRNHSPTLHLSSNSLTSAVSLIAADENHDKSGLQIIYE